MTLALPGTTGSYCPGATDPDPFIHQEMIEMLYHTLWETVHVFFEHRELGHDVGEAGFLYPFLGRDKQSTSDVMAECLGVDPDESGRRCRAARAGGGANRRRRWRRRRLLSASVCAAAAS